MLQATAYVHAIQQYFDEKPGIRYVILVKTKKPQMQIVETVRNDEDAARLGDLIQAVERAIDAEAFYPNESVHELLRVPILSPVPGMAGLQQSPHDPAAHGGGSVLTELYNKGGRVCREARKGNIRCRLIVRPTSEDVITGHSAQAFRILNPRWFLPDILNHRPEGSAVSEASLPGAASRTLEKSARYPRELLPWDEGTTQVDLTISFENPPTTIYFEVKYLGWVVTQYVSNGPSNQLIRNIRVGLLECGWFSKGDLVAVPPRDFVCILLSPSKGNELVRYYQNPENVMAAIPHNDKLVGLPKTPFVGELTYGELDPRAETSAAKIHEAGKTGH